MENFHPLGFDEGSGQATLPCTLPWFIGQLVDGGIHAGQRTLVYGEKGVGKTTISGQLAVGFAEAGVRCLILTAELGEEELIARMYKAFGPQLSRDAVFDNIRVAEVDGIDRFQEMINIIREARDNFQPQVVFLDSLQGMGLASYNSGAWQRFYSLMRELKEVGIASILIGHATKNLQAAGPASLQHEVDLILSIRKAGDRRLIWVPKNRCGASRELPMIFKVDRVGRLFPDERARQTMIGRAVSIDDGFIEIEAKVNFASSSFSSDRFMLNGVRERQYKKIVDILSYQGFDLSGFEKTISCNIPGDQKGCKPWLDLPLCVALLASYLQKPIGPWLVFVGELGLDGRILDAPNPFVLSQLAVAIDRARKQGRRLQVFAPGALCVDVAFRANLPFNIWNTPAVDLRNVLEITWPDFRSQAKAGPSRGGLLGGFDK